MTTRAETVAERPKLSLTPKAGYYTHAGGIYAGKLGIRTFDIFGTMPEKLILDFNQRVKILNYDYIFANTASCKQVSVFAMLAKCVETHPDETKTFAIQLIIDHIHNGRITQIIPEDELESYIMTGSASEIEILSLITSTISLKKVPEYGTIPSRNFILYSLYALMNPNITVLSAIDYDKQPEDHKLFTYEKKQFISYCPAIGVLKNNMFDIKSDGTPKPGRKILCYAISALTILLTIPPFVRRIHEHTIMQLENLFFRGIRNIQWMLMSSIVNDTTVSAAMFSIFNTPRLQHYLKPEAQDVREFTIDFCNELEDQGINTAAFVTIPALVDAHTESPSYYIKGREDGKLYTFDEIIVYCMEEHYLKQPTYDIIVVTHVIERTHSVRTSMITNLEIGDNQYSLHGASLYVDMPGDSGHYIAMLHCQTSMYFYDSDKLDMNGSDYLKCASAMLVYVKRPKRLITGSFMATAA